MTSINFVCPEEESTDPAAHVIFLAGPILGAPDWQMSAMKMMAEENVVVANPRALSFDHGFEAQVDWETRWLSRAAFRGVILFWLSYEAAPQPGRAFGQTTRFELGEWLSKTVYTKAQVVVGADNAFTGLGYIRHRLRDYPRVPPIQSTLKETVELALSYCR